MFCTGCGTQSRGDDVFCSACGNAQRQSSANAVSVAAEPAIFKVGQAAQEQAIPDGIKGWSWGAFLLSWIWAMGNRTWIGLLALIPYVNILVMFWLGIKGREMAWRNCQWDSVEHFNRVQRAWTQWALVITAIMAVLLTLFMLVIVQGIIKQSAPEADEAVVQQTSATSARLPYSLAERRPLFSDTKPAENHAK